MKANANMGDSHSSYKRNAAQQKRSVTTSPGAKAGGPKIINKGGGTTNSGAV